MGFEPLIRLSNITRGLAGHAVDLGPHRKTVVKWGCCGVEEDVTGQQYVYPWKHEEVCRGRDADKEARP